MSETKKNWLSKNKIWLIVGLAGLTLLLVFRQAKAKSTTIPKGKTEKTVTVKQGNLTQTLELSGHLQAEENLTLRFQTSGLLTWVAVKEGDWVRRGQALATLDRRALEKTLKKELNDYSKERADFEQDQDDHKLVREGLVIDYEIRRILDKAQWDLENSVIDVELADLSHRLAVLSSPIAGIITKVDQPFAGVNITPATAEFTVVNPSTIYFEASADEDELQEIPASASAQITLDAYPEETIDSKLIFQSFVPLTSSNTISYRLKFSLPVDNSNLKYRLGMSGDAQIISRQSSNTLYIPLEALNEKEGRTFVILKSSPKNLEQEVEIGLETDEYVEIVSGLNAEQTLVYYE